MSLKIIQILHHSPSWTSKNIDDDIFDGWHVRTAKAIQDLAIKDCKIECWLPEKTKSQEWQIENDGIKYRMFPSCAINYGREISLAMIKALKQEKNNQILLHIHGIFNYTTYLIAKLFGHLPIVVQHHGDCPPLNLLERRKLLYTILPLLEFEYFLLDRTIHNIDFFFCLTETAQKSLSYLGIKNKSTIQGMGVDFTKFTPAPKLEARQELKLPLDSQIILYIGKLDRYKGSDKLITVYNKLRQKYNNLTLVIVGASESDTLYQAAIKSKAMIFPRQSHNNLKFFYQSADVFVLPGSQQYNRWGGIGINTIESLACNTPVVSGTLCHFPDNYQNLGVYVSNTDQLINGIELILNHPDRFTNARELTKRHYNWNHIANNTYLIYKQLFLKYYNTKIEKEKE